MYEEDKKVINWRKIIFRAIVIILVIVLLVLLLPLKNKNTGNSNKVFASNINKFKDVGNKYFNENNVPKDDTTLVITLDKLIKEKKINELVDEKGKSCDKEKSYLKVFKMSVGYEMEVNLVCDKKEDSSFVYLGCFGACDTSSKTTTKTTTTTKTKKPTTKSTTKKTTTTTTIKKEPIVKKYAVIFNVNGGTSVNHLYVESGMKANKPVDPTRDGYTFAGWELNDKLYDFNNPVYKNIVLIAKWIPDI